MALIFISYRREDSADVTDRINERLAKRFSQDQIFTDVDSIPLGVNFEQYIDEHVGNCQIFLTVVGRDWLSITDEQGQPRLQNPNDFVRLEIESALRRHIPVIPLLVRGAKMPNAKDLPKSLEELAVRNGTKIRPNPDFHSDMNRLVKGIEKHIEQQAKAEAQRHADLNVTERKGKGQQKKNYERREEMRSMIKKKEWLSHADKEKREADVAKAERKAASDSRASRLQPSIPQVDTSLPAEEVEPTPPQETNQSSVLHSELTPMTEEAPSAGIIYPQKTTKAPYTSTFLISFGWVIGGDINVDIDGAIGGLVTGFVLQRTEPTIRSKQVLLIALGWAIGPAIGYIIDGSIDGSIGYIIDGSIGYIIYGRAIYGAIVGAIGGLVTGFVLQRTEPTIRSKQVLLIALGWAIGYTIGYTIGGVIGYIIVGAIGGGFMLIMLQWLEGKNKG